MSKHTGPPHVALIVETSTAFGRGVLRGVGIYIRENGPWSVYVEQRSIYDPAPSWLKRWDGDGIISRAAYPDLAQLVLRTGIPTVDLQEQVLDMGLPRIVNDNAAIGRMAADHLLERGFKHFGFLGHPSIGWSDDRRKGFQTCLKKSGFDCDEFGATRKTLPRYHQRSWENEMDDVADWIKSLPKPAGIMACNDFRAVQLLDACRRAAVAVPEEVAVIGVDNEEVACEMASPQLSSVVTNALHIGYEAAATLDLLMRGKTPREPVVLVPPTGVVVRRSSEVMAIEDPLVAQAMQYIRKNAAQGINVDDLLQYIAVSRSALQRRFQMAIKKSIHEAILDERLRVVKSLLAETTLTRDQIAERSGFEHPEYLSMVFKRKIGMTMSLYRRKNGRSKPYS